MTVELFGALNKAGQALQIARLRRRPLAAGWSP